MLSSSSVSAQTVVQNRIPSCIFVGLKRCVSESCQDGTLGKKLHAGSATPISDV